MRHTVVGKRISPRLQGLKDIRYIVNLKSNIEGDEGWESTIIVSGEVFESLNFGDRVEITFHRADTYEGVAVLDAANA